MLNKEFLQRKVKLIQEDLVKLEPLLHRSFADVTSDDLAYSALERWLERIVTRAIDINRHIISELGKGTEKVRSYQDTYLALSTLGVYSEEFAKQIAPSAGLRNVLVHEYDDVDKKLIYESINDAVSQYTEYCASILSLISK